MFIYIVFIYILLIFSLNILLDTLIKMLRITYNKILKLKIVSFLDNRNLETTVQMQSGLDHFSIIIA
mgnify:CR=1 FL=1|jgi:hypothetical protein